MREKESAPIEAIDFTSLQEHSKNQTATKDKVKKPNSKIWFMFIFLVLCGLAVIFLLPEYVAKQQNTQPIESDIVEAPIAIKPAIEESSADEIAEKQTETAEVETPILSAEELSALKLQAEELLLQIIEKQEVLQQQAVNKWADEEFKHALNLGATGDENFRKQNFLQAIEAYQDAVEALSKLEQQIAPTLAKHLEQGELALTQVEKETAIFHFSIAQAIEANNQQASIGLQRSETIIELFALLEKGGNIEAANRLQDALLIYQQAKELDSFSPEAKIAYDRVNSRLTEQKFKQFIASAYRALKAKQYEDARSSFQQAQTLLPNSDEPKQGLSKIAQAIQQEKLTALRAEALHFEDNEEWNYAAESYQQILTLAPNSSFAKNGMQNAQQHFALLNKLDAYINDELRLSTSQVADEANKLLQEITQLDIPGDKITQRADRLKVMLVRASQPISITLESDNLTNIVVFKIAKFGKFESKQLQLKPGKYTLVGSRPGYRDIRKVLLVTADMQEKVFTVRCEEQI